jgi:acyl-CoA thioesterase FadM
MALGVMHTDSNQHVNSLVYPRLFEEAALRRFAVLGKSTTVLARSIDIAYRRPSFAGDTLRIFVRAFENAAIGYFFGTNDDPSDVKKARAFVQMRFA